VIQSTEIEFKQILIIQLQIYGAGTMIKVVSIKFSQWMKNSAEGAQVLGDFQAHDEAVTAIWTHLVQERQHCAYLLLEHHWWWNWFPPRYIFWGAVQDGMPKIYQEQLDRFSAKRVLKMYKG
jgi:hypothetical protein